jgi:actin-related protein
MLEFVLITGGGSKVRGLRERIERELRMVNETCERIEVIHPYSLKYLA